MAARKKHSHSIIRFIFRTILTLILVGILCACFCGMAFAYYVHAYINPAVQEDMSQLANGMGLDLNSFIYATDPETGQEVLYETLKGTENRIWVDGDEIPEYLKMAIVAIEDQRFYMHKGVDWKRTAGAVQTWIFGGQQYGGSTITQQLIKNATKDDDYSVKRKVTEIFRALTLEELIADKDRLLEMYLNTIYLGRNCYGVKTAAATYFGKDISQLDLAECAIIAGITKNPSYYDPYTYPEHIRERQQVILEEMLKQGMIDQATHDTAAAEELNYRSVEMYNEDLSDPYSYFTDAVFDDVVNDLMEQKGYSELVATDLVNSGGLKIYATIDTRVQQIMDEEYQKDSNFPDMTRGEENSRPESAMVICDKQGNIRGIVGGRGVKEGKRTFSRATHARRQPGSSFKPLASYGPAMDKGIIVPTSTVYDKPLKEDENGNPWPRNDSGRITGAPMVIKEAITHSVNTVSVQVMDMLTPNESYNYLVNRLGFKSGEDALVMSRTNADGSVQSDIDYAPLALGGLTNGVTVREMAGGYTSFINEGVYPGTRTYTRVLDSEGNVLLENTPRTDLGFFNVRTAYFMLECMQAVTSRGTASNVGIPGVETAGKTGTTSANYDRWFCGVTPEYSAAVWFGFDAKYTLSGLGGSNPASVMWNNVMNRIHEGDSGLKFDSHPDDFENASYCMDSGLAPSGACRNAGRVATGRFWKGKVPTDICKHQGFEKYDYGKTTGIDYSNVEPEESYSPKPKPQTPEPQQPVVIDPNMVAPDPNAGTTTTPTTPSTTDPTTSPPDVSVDPEYPNGKPSDAVEPEPPATQDPGIQDPVTSDPGSTTDPGVTPDPSGTTTPEPTTPDTPDTSTPETDPNLYQDPEA